MEYKTKIGMAVEKSGLKPSFIVKKASIDRTTLWRMCAKEEYEPKISNVIRLAKLLKVDISELV